MPFVLCEYSHAGATAPGGLGVQELFDRTNAARAASSGSGWTTASAARTGPIAYGGDFGEELHDGTYVLDGLVFPDLTPQPVLAEVRKAFEPVHLKLSPDVLHLTNRYDVLDTTHLSLHWELADEGLLVAQGSLELPVVPAGSEATVELPDFPAPAQNRERWLTVRAVLGADTPWAAAGHEVAFAQTQLPVESAPWKTPSGCFAEASGNCRAWPRAVLSPDRSVGGAAARGRSSMCRWSCGGRPLSMMRGLGTRPR